MLTRNSKSPLEFWMLFCNSSWLNLVDIQMKTEKILTHLIKPLVLSGVYKDKTVALKDIVVTHIENKIKSYDKIIKTFQRKYGKDFDTFSKDLKNKATPELEDDWMEWKGAIEMKKAWNEALKEVIESEAAV